MKLNNGDQDYDYDLSCLSVEALHGQKHDLGELLITGTILSEF